MAYGLEIYKSNGTTKLVQVTSDIPAFVKVDSFTISANGSVTIPVTGLLNTAQWVIIVKPGIGGNNFFDVTKSTGQFTIDNLTSQEVGGVYWVIRRG